MKLGVGVWRSRVSGEDRRCWNMAGWCLSQRALGSVVLGRFRGLGTCSLS